MIKKNNKIISIQVIFFSGVFIIFFLFLPLLFMLNKKLAYYSYKEVVYRTIINNVIGKERETEKVSLLLLDYIYYYMFSPAEATPVDKDVYSDLIRGTACCDQRSWALCTFLGKSGIDNRMVMIKGPDGKIYHAVLEAFIAKKWRFFDSMKGLIIKDNNGELASYEDICRNPSLFYLSPPLLMLKELEPERYIKVQDFFTRNLFYNNPVKPEIWANPVQSKGLGRRIVTKVLDSYIYLFGKNFSYLYQDIYLEYFSPDNKGDRAFFKARNYDLFNRYEPATEMYKNFIENFPGNAASEDAIFFLGTLYNRTHNLESSINILQGLLKKYPQTKWMRIAYYYIGYDYELLGNYSLAEDYYHKALDMYKQIEKEDLGPGDLKVIRRLYNLVNSKKNI